MKLLTEQREIDQLDKRHLQLQPDLTLLMVLKRPVSRDFMNDLCLASIKSSYRPEASSSAEELPRLEKRSNPRC